MLLDVANKRLFVPNTRSESGTYQLAFTTIDDQGMVDVKDDELQLTGQATNKFVYSNQSWPFGYLVVRKDRVIAGAESGPMTWDIGRKDNPLFRYLLGGASHHIAMAKHPQQSVIYSVATGTPYVFQVRHVAGYITLLPQRLTLGAADDLQWYCEPVLLSHARQLALSDKEGRVFLLSLDEKGRFAGQVQQVAIEGEASYGRGTPLCAALRSFVCQCE